MARKDRRVGLVRKSKGLIEFEQRSMARYKASLINVTIYLEEGSDGLKKNKRVLHVEHHFKPTKLHLDTLKDGSYTIKSNYPIIKAVLSPMSAAYVLGMR